MTYLQLLDTLYFGKLDEILDVLNQSQYANQTHFTRGTHLFHTGFRFQTHKGTEISLLYHPQTETIVREPEKHFVYRPAFNGLVIDVNQDNGYYAKFFPLCVGCFDIEGGCIYLKLSNPYGFKDRSAIDMVPCLDNDTGNTVIHRSLNVYEDEKLISEFPLYKVDISEG